MRRRWSLCSQVTIVACGVTIALAIGVPGAAAPSIAPGDLLPDLVQESPQNIGVSRARGRDLLGFRSAVHNAGDGPLIVMARRANRSVRDMTARQRILRTDGSTRDAGQVGFTRYVRSLDHSHWHFLPFERYELRREGSSTGIVRDRKTGFCLGDRYRAEPRPDNAVLVARYVGRCGFADPARLSVTQGISVGWGDDYAAYLDGQHIDVTDLPAGRYVLVHTVNVRGQILERDRSNNSASRRIELRRVSGRVQVRILSPSG